MSIEEFRNEKLIINGSEIKIKKLNILSGDRYLDLFKISDMLAVFRNMISDIDYWFITPNPQNQDHTSEYFNERYPLFSSNKNSHIIYHRNGFEIEYKNNKLVLKEYNSDNDKLNKSVTRFKIDMNSLFAINKNEKNIDLLSEEWKSILKPHENVSEYDLDNIDYNHALLLNKLENESDFLYEIIWDYPEYLIDNKDMIHFGKILCKLLNNKNCSSITIISKSIALFNVLNNHIVSYDLSNKKMYHFDNEICNEYVKGNYGYLDYDNISVYEICDNQIFNIDDPSLRWNGKRFIFFNDICKTLDKQSDISEDLLWTLTELESEVNQ